MAHGTVKWFDENENHGFIQRDDGPDVFVDGNAIIGPSLTEGQPVEFDITPGPRGPHARNVRAL